MFLKFLILTTLALVLLGGKRRLGALAQGLTKLPASFREGKGRAEDPAACAREVKGSTRTPGTPTDAPR